MALITCKDCQKEFSDDAKRCPHCGAKKPKPPKVPFKKTKTANIIAGLFIFMLIGQLLHPSAPSPTLPLEQARLAKMKEEMNVAKYYCREQITKVVNDPDSVKYDNEYPASDYGGVVEKKGSKNVVFEIQTALRARNAFGAYIRKVAECDYIYTTGGKIIPLGVRGL